MSLVLNADTGASMIQDNTVTSAKVVDGSIQVGDTTGFPRMLLSTAKTASGTSVDFTDVPSWAKKITVSLISTSLSGTDQAMALLGVGGVPQTSGYTSGVKTAQNAGANNVTVDSVRVRLFDPIAGDASLTTSGHITFVSIGGNSWSFIGVFRTGTYMSEVAGIAILTGELTGVHIRPTGTNVFDAGSINVLYEGY